eukprot:279171-Ditylum_brightwellii.AAC.1
MVTLLFIKDRHVYSRDFYCQGKEKVAHNIDYFCVALPSSKTACYPTAVDINLTALLDLRPIANMYQCKD